MEGFAGACGLVSFEIQHCWRIIYQSFSSCHAGAKENGCRSGSNFNKDCYQVNQTPTAQVMIYPMVSGFWSSLGLAPNFRKIPKTVDPVEPISKRPGHHKSQHWAPSLGVSWLQTNGWLPATEGAWHKHQWHLSNWWIPHEKKDSSKVGCFMLFH